MANLLKTPVSAAEYNKIPLYSAIASLNETPELHKQLPLLIELGDIFVRHSVEGQWGIHLLHRHFAIPDSTVMVYDVVDLALDLCNFVSEKEAQQSSARPRAYLLNGSGQFQAYEFETGPGQEAADPPAAFLEEFASFLKDSQLESIVALSKERAEDQCNRREEYLFNGKSTVSLRHVDISEPAIISTHPESHYMGHSGWSFTKGAPENPNAAAKNFLTTSTTKNSVKFSIYTVASHTHQQFTKNEDIITESAIVLADDSVECTHENVREVIAQL